MANRLVRIDNLAEVRASLGKTGEVARRAARLAINDTARKTRTRGSKEIRKQVNLSARYVNQNLRLAQTASESDLSAVIAARQRPTQLSRYGAKQLTRKAKHPERSTGDPGLRIPPGRKAAGVSVKVKKGGSRQKLRGAFLIPLQNTVRMGLAVRTGSEPDDYEVKYGPSVDQVFRDVREDIADDTGEQVSTEFRRQLARLL